MSISADRDDQSNGKTALMWGGLLTFFGALFHVGILIAGPEWTYLAGIPDTLANYLNLNPHVSLLIIIALLLGISVFAAFCRGEFGEKPIAKPILFFIAAILIIWGIAGAPLQHLRDWSHGYSVFHVMAAVYITLMGVCFGLAALALPRSSEASSE